MNVNITSMLNELLDESAPPSQEALLRFVEETFGFLRGLKGKFDSKDPKQREEAIADAQEVQLALWSRLTVLAEKAGLDLAQGANALSSEEKSLADEVQEKLEQIEKSGHHSRIIKKS